MSYFIESSKVKRQELAPGVSIRTMWGEKIMVSILESAPHAVVKDHVHPHEQAGIVLQGEFEMNIGHETKHMRPGDAYVIPGGVEHGIVGDDGWALVLDVFSPVRDEYKK